MSVNRHLSRTVAMQSIYEWDFRPDEPLNDIVRRNIEVYKDDVDEGYVIQVVEGIKKNITEIDASIVNVAPEFPIEQIATIDKAILRVAIYEILHDNDVPAKVAINEAVELGKNFGGESSYKFINGVLGTLYRQSARFDPNDEKILEPIDEIVDGDINTDDIKEDSK
ncbi:transcription antitermination factor NusB [Candidatus Berkelbacteria bacterium CG06_land_8_20_14_3_00_43_10]|uniref:Transcription antitermination protein NusB n=1 Tax=Candidatus Berkelbacteria bacterium CG10_big_fil_rev_8_21_14_0_10_43_14 TaxID=1974515 RepID=A0A2M6R863_9BACT|nr:MAG: transcription antitermination factor NusB [Candidatus Berkelbacteria bacterium CG2_30_43_20]PIS06752.1 MAG: transcription antitermination factor NusB [Candidatus Berkelbacteria bacterium CG10_big_fil_rev_8_21_14_0_10_43_14]PIU87071.1 MAG: transcription antitermination factor NusB [Candidatus Berkelbacteria bacterium CG06_land_8_20_14_3_00_43_10]